MTKPSSVFPIAYFNNKYLPIEEANVSIMTNAFNYGTGVFGGTRGYLSHDEKQVALFKVEEHSKRIVNAAKILGVASPVTQQDVEEVFRQLMIRNKPTTDCYIRTLIYNSSHGLTPKFTGEPIAFASYMIPLGHYLDINKGLKACISSWTRINDNMIPARGKVTGGYINSALARSEAELNGFDEAIVLDKNGHVSEGSAENIFIVRNGTLITSPVYSDILEGITRGTVLELAKDLGIPTETRDIDRTELYIADEVFFSGTGVQVAWIHSIDHRIIGEGTIGSITKKIQETFFDVVRGKNTKHKNWLTTSS